jgi:hypothetical protein
MTDDIPSAKIRMLKSSFRCFVFGVLGLLPVIGLPFAIAALVVSARVRAGQKKFWNAARPYWIWGEACAAVGTVLWSVIDAILIYYSMTNGSFH